jgi:hypothetical protein
MNLKRKEILTLLLISFVFGVLDFHYQNTISPLFSRIFGNSNNPFLLVPLFIYMLLPWYILSTYVLYLLKKKSLYTLKTLLLATILAYLISVISYYLHYIFLLFFVGLPNFENIKFVFTKENIAYAFNTLFLPGIIEWGIGAIILGSMVSVFNYFIIPKLEKLLEGIAIKKKY